MSQIPREGGVQSVVGLLREGFPYIQNRCRRFRSDLFEIAVPFAQVVCMSGRQATELFYDTSRFERLLARTVPAVGQEPLQLHSAGRRRLPPGTPLPG